MISNNSNILPDLVRINFIHMGSMVNRSRPSWRSSQGEIYGSAEYDISSSMQVAVILDFALENNILNQTPVMYEIYINVSLVKT